VILYDEITGVGRHVVDVVFQFASGHLALDAAARRAEFDGRFELAWASSGEFETSMACGGPMPADGWIAPSLGVRVAAPRLTLRAQMETGSLTLLTILADGARNRISVSAEPEPFLARICGVDFEDEVYAARQRSVKVSGISTDAPLVVVRRGCAGTKVAQAGGTWVRFDCARSDASEHGLMR
jgi:hypothetical protein